MVDCSRVKGQRYSAIKRDLVDIIGLTEESNKGEKDMMISDCGNEISGVKAIIRIYKDEEKLHGCIEPKAQKGSLPRLITRNREFEDIDQIGKELESLYKEVEDYNRRKTEEAERVKTQEAIAETQARLCQLQRDQMKARRDLRYVNEEIYSETRRLRGLEKNL